MREVGWESSTLKDAPRLDRKTRERIIAAVERLAWTEHGEVRRVMELPGVLALRVGDRRAFYVETAEIVDGKQVDIPRVPRVHPRCRACGR